MAPEGVHAPALFLSRIGQEEGADEKKLKGKIKARSRTRSQAIVCTSFFSETRFRIGGNCETRGAVTAPNCGLEQSPSSFAPPTALTR
jgi:hypothetical protein